MRKPKQNSAKLKPGRRMWGGYVEDRLHVMEVDTGWGGFGTGSFAFVPALFRVKRDASARYEDVRPIVIPTT